MAPWQRPLSPGASAGSARSGRGGDRFPEGRVGRRVLSGIDRFRHQNGCTLRADEARLAPDENLFQLGRGQRGMAVWADDTDHGGLLRTVIIYSQSEAAMLHQAPSVAHRHRFARGSNRNGRWRSAARRCRPHVGRYAEALGTKADRLGRRERIPPRLNVPGRAADRASGDTGRGALRTDQGSLRKPALRWLPSQ